MALPTSLSEQRVGFFLMIIQLLLDPQLQPQLVALLEALPARSRATKVRMMLEAHLSGDSRTMQSPAMAQITPTAGTAADKQTRSAMNAQSSSSPDSSLSDDPGSYFEELEGLSL